MTDLTASNEAGPQTPQTSPGQLWRNLAIGRKLSIGFGVLVVITLVVVGWSFLGSAEATENIDRTEELRVPTALDSAGAQANLLRMLASIRGYLALGDQQYRDDYNQARRDFEMDLAKLEARSADWTDPDNNRRLAELQTLLDKWAPLPDELFDLRDDQLRREPAFRLLIEEASPLSGQILQDAKNMIDVQVKLAASADRIGADDVDLLKDMANFQGTFAQMISGLRGYVTTRRESFKFEYETALKINEVGWERLTSSRNELPTTQILLLDRIAANRAAFLELPPRMFEILEDEEGRWRTDLYRFRTEAVPATEEMLRLLDEMTEDQQASLKTDLAAGRAGLATARVITLVGGGLAVVLGTTLAFIFRANIAGPIVRLTGVAERIRGGDLGAQAAVESGDEIGHLADVFNKMAAQLQETLAGLTQEVAERRRAEAELRQHRDHLEELVAERTVALVTANEQLQQEVAERQRAEETLKAYAAELERSNRELEEFARIASHDLQEPLRKIRAFGGRLKIKYSDALDDQGHDYLERMQNATTRMQTFINDLLTFSRVTTQAQPFVPVDLVTMTREVVSDLEVRIEETNGRVEIGDLPTIDADSLQIRQLLQNLISNALKFHRPEEPPLVKVYDQHLADQKRDLNGHAPGNGLCQIVIEDNGIGFDEKHLDRIFGMFQRLHGRSAYEGTGIGLAVCRKIVERHSGSITARSAPGQGTTFIVTLPVKQSAY